MSAGDLDDGRVPLAFQNRFCGLAGTLDDRLLVHNDWYMGNDTYAPPCTIADPVLH